jgi:hypothetical protein
MTALFHSYDKRLLPKDQVTLTGFAAAIRVEFGLAQSAVRGGGSESARCLACAGHRRIFGAFFPTFRSWCRLAARRFVTYLLEVFRLNSATVKGALGCSFLPAWPRSFFQDHLACSLEIRNHQSSRSCART